MQEHLYPNKGVIEETDRLTGVGGNDATYNFPLNELGTYINSLPTAGGIVNTIVRELGTTQLDIAVLVNAIAPFTVNSNDVTYFTIERSSGYVEVYLFRAGAGTYGSGSTTTTSSDFLLLDPEFILPDNIAYTDRSNTFTESQTITDATATLRIRSTGDNLPSILYIDTPSPFTSTGEIRFVQNGSTGSIGGISYNYANEQLTLRRGFVDSIEITSLGLDLRSGNYLLRGVNINTPGTLTNVAYQNQVNNFTMNQFFQGDVTVSGDFIRQNVTDIDISDNVIVINDGETSAGVGVMFAGVQIDRGTLPDVGLIFDESDDQPKFGEFNTLDGDVQAATTNTITLDSSASSTDDEYNGMFLKVFKAGETAQSVQITDYVGSTRIATVTPNFSATIDNTWSYRILVSNQLNTIWHAGNDGTGSGLDADFIDGIQGAVLARTDRQNTFNNTQTFNAGINSLHGFALGRAGSEYLSTNTFYAQHIRAVDVLDRSGDTSGMYGNYQFLLPSGQRLAGVRMGESSGFTSSPNLTVYSRFSGGHVRLEEQSGVKFSTTTTGTQTTGNSLPSVAGMYDLGSFSVRWRDAYFSRNILIGTTGLVGTSTNNSLRFGTDFTPYINSTENFVINLDTNNNDTSAEFQVRHNSETQSGGELLFDVNESGEGTFLGGVTAGATLRGTGLTLTQGLIQLSGSNRTYDIRGNGTGGYNIGFGNGSGQLRYYGGTTSIKFFADNAGNGMFANSLQLGDGTDTGARILTFQRGTATDSVTDGRIRVEAGDMFVELRNSITGGNWWRMIDMDGDLLAPRLYWRNALRLAPVNGGVDITGDVDITGNYLVNGVAMSSGGLLQVTEGGRTGFRRADAVAANYGNIGNRAVDVSYSSSTSSTRGATGSESFAANLNNIVSGTHSAGFGASNFVTGGNCIGAGVSNTVSGNSSACFGQSNGARGQFGLVAGNSVSVQSGCDYCFAAGQSNTITSSDWAAAIGQGISISSRNNQFVIGRYNSDVDALFVVGNGTSSTVRGNAFAIHTSGISVGDGLTGTKTIQLNGAGSASSVMNLDFDGGGTGNPRARLSFGALTRELAFLVGNAGSEAEKFRLISTGTTTTGEQIVVNDSDGDVGLRIRRNSSTGRAQITFERGGGSELWRFGATGAGSEDFTWNNGVNRMILNATGNLDVFGDIALAKVDGGPNLDLFRDDSSIVAGNQIGRLSFSADDADATKREYASLRAVASQNHSNGNAGTYLAFFATPTGSISSVEKLAIDGNGVAVTGRIRTGASNIYTYLSDNVLSATNGLNINVGSGDPDGTLTVFQALSADGAGIIRYGGNEKLRTTTNCLMLTDVPTSASGLSAGEIYRNGNQLMIAT